MHCITLGDQAVLAYCADEATAARLAALVRQAAAPWLVDVVQAYASVGVFFDLLRITYAEVVAHLEALRAARRRPRWRRVGCTTSRAVMSCTSTWSGSRRRRGYRRTR